MCVSLSPLRGRCQDRIKCSRILLGGMPAKDDEEVAGEDEEGRRPKACKSDPEARTKGGRLGKFRASVQPKASSAQQLGPWDRCSTCR